MLDEWTKPSPDGKTVTYKMEGEPRVGFVYSAGVEGRNIKQLSTSEGPLTREQVEARFADYVAGE